MEFCPTKASAGAREASNAFSTYPTISGAPSGDGITVQLRTRQLVPLGLVKSLVTGVDGWQFDKKILVSSVVGLGDGGK